MSSGVSDDPKQLAEPGASAKHPHEPEIPPALDAEGRCLVCGLLASLEKAEKAAKQLDGLKWADPRCYCGSLWWTVEHHGRVTHKHGCPARREPFCQSHPDGVGCAALSPARSSTAEEREAVLNDIAEEGPHV